MHVSGSHVSALPKDGSRAHAQGPIWGHAGEAYLDQASTQPAHNGRDSMHGECVHTRS